MKIINISHLYTRGRDPIPDILINCFVVLMKNIYLLCGTWLLLRVMGHAKAFVSSLFSFHETYADPICSMEKSFLCQYKYKSQIPNILAIQSRSTQASRVSLEKKTQV